MHDFSAKTTEEGYGPVLFHGGSATALRRTAPQVPGGPLRAPRVAGPLYRQAAARLGRQRRRRQYLQQEGAGDQSRIQREVAPRARDAQRPSANATHPNDAAADVNDLSA